MDSPLALTVLVTPLKENVIESPAFLALIPNSFNRSNSFVSASKIPSVNWLKL